MSASKAEFTQRWSAFPPELRELASHDPLVQRCMTQYAIGHAASLQEALTKLVLVLAAVASEQHRALVRFHASHSVHVVVTNGHEADPRLATPPPVAMTMSADTAEPVAITYTKAT